MSSFRHIDNFDTAEVAADIDRMRLDLFDPLRDFTLPGLKHKSIFLRCHTSPDLQNWLEDLPVYDWPILQGWRAMRLLLQRAHDLIRADPHFAPRINPDAPMGRVALSVIQPEGFIQCHTDLGLYAQKHLRFHVPVVTNAEAVVYARSERMRLPAGALTWLDVQTLHGAENWAPTWRTHAVFEVRGAA